ncbi:MAG: hypothetical protein WD013_02750 [Gemmatimonadota bacterium]
MNSFQPVNLFSTPNVYRFGGRDAASDAVRIRTLPGPDRESAILEDEMLSTLLTLFAAGLVTLLVIGIALSLVGIVFSLTLGLASFLLFKVGPILLVGWIVLKLIDSRKSRRQLSAADRAWLDAGE